MAADPTRRAVLAAAAALPLITVAGCKGVGALAAPPRPAPDVGVLTAALAQERSLIARYAAVIAGPPRPRLAGLLEPVLAEHRAHLAQLQARLIVPQGAPPPRPAPSGSASRPAAAGGTGHPATPQAALAGLRAAERRASASLLSQLGAAPPSLAQLLASISASEATHAASLQEAARNL